MFSCFNPDKTPGRRCEWKGGNLQEFASQYNRECGTTYVLAECLDAPKAGAQQPGLKQPEVLLRGGRGERPMVIERKQVVSESYAIHHGNLHILYEMVPESLAPHFGDALYALEIGDESLRGRRKREGQAAAREITGHVVSNLEGVKGGAVVGGRHHSHGGSAGFLRTRETTTPRRWGSASRSTARVIFLTTRRPYCVRSKRRTQKRRECWSSGSPRRRRSSSPTGTTSRRWCWSFTATGAF